MEMTERVAQVLKEHLHCSGTHCFHNDATYEVLRDNLTALWKEPDRKELYRLMGRVAYLASIEDKWDYKTQEEMANRFRAWARGKTAKREWCKHWELTGAGEWLRRDADPRFPKNYAQDDWGQCPIHGCGAQRPVKEAS